MTENRPTFRHLSVRTAVATVAVLALSAASAGAQVYDAQLSVTGQANPAGTANTPSFAVPSANVPGTTATIAAQTMPAAIPSPYAATVSSALLPGGMMNLNVFCVDMLNTISIPSGSYAIKATSLGTVSTLTATRYTDASALTRYKKAGYLSALWSTVATAEKDDLQMAIWSVMYDGFGATGNLVPTSALTGAAQLFVARANGVAAANFTGVDFSQAFVLTDAAVAPLSVNSLARYDGTGRQEFVTGVAVVPEPSTYLLMGTGMLGLAGIARRRRQSTQR
ncbi:MAG: PEP-CTERM sorting domain-containing protein [Gemmatirosa sp.]